MYALKGDFGTWVCAINAGRRHVALNFLTAACSRMRGTSFGPAARCS